MGESWTEIASVEKDGGVGGPPAPVSPLIDSRSRRAPFAPSFNPQPKETAELGFNGEATIAAAARSDVDSNSAGSGGEGEPQTREDLRGPRKP